MKTFDKQLLYGCMGLGGDWEASALTKDDLIIAEQAIESAMEAGITFFDHADIYKAGRSETVFGEVLKNRPALRDKISIQSKAGIKHHQGVLKSNIYDTDKAYIFDQVDQILKRLHTDYLDVFMIHRPDPLMHPEELAELFRTLNNSGKVKHFGVSNMSRHQLDLMQFHLDEPLKANQIQLSLGHSLPLDAGVLVNRINNIDYNGVEGLLEYMHRHQMAIQCWGSLDSGRFTGNYELASADDKRAINLVHELSEKYNTTKESIVLAWLLKLPGRMQPVIGTKNRERILACKDAMHIDLSRQEWYDLWILARGERIP